MSARDRVGLERYRGVLAPAEFEELRRAVERPLTPAIRLNTLKTTVEGARSSWPGRYRWEVETVPFCETGWRIVEGGDDLARTAEHKMGHYYIQGAASMLPAELFQMGKELIVLDMAAAPGGKSTHLVSRLRDRGLLIANEKSAGRMAPLRTNIQDWGATSTVITNAPGELWGNWTPESFDRVLLDAPCSGQGLRTAERRRAQAISEKGREALQATQIQLLLSGFQALKVGGELVYATCTMHPDENEAVLEALLERYPGAATIGSVENIVRAPALTRDGEREFRPEVGRAARLWPHIYDTAGFFAALIVKRGATPIERQPYPVRPLRERGYRPLPPDEEAEWVEELRDRYHFDLAAVMEAQNLSLWQRGENIYLFPDLYLSHFGDLPMVAAGMLVAEKAGAVCETPLPSHEFVSRFGGEFGAGRLVITAEEGERWLQGRELRGRDPDVPPGAGRGAVVLVEDELGRFLGRGKVLGNRVRNLLPRRLVY